MEATLYFLVKIACAIFILWHLWLFIFGQKMYEVWDRLYHHMRIVRIRLWKYRKKRMAEKIRSASRKTRHGKNSPGNRCQIQLDQELKWNHPLLPKTMM